MRLRNARALDSFGPLLFFSLLRPTKKERKAVEAARMRPTSAPISCQNTVQTVSSLVPSRRPESRTMVIETTPIVRQREQARAIFWVQRTLIWEMRRTGMSRTVRLISAILILEIMGKLLKTSPIRSRDICEMEKWIDLQNSDPSEQVTISIISINLHKHTLRS